MTETLRPDLCVIGAGSGGRSVVMGAAALGVSVVLVEKAEMGRAGSADRDISRSALIVAAQAADTMRQANRFGITAVEPNVDAARVHAHIHAVHDRIAPNHSQARFEAMGVRVIRAAGRFMSRDALEAGGLTIRARRFVLATGSSPVTPPIPGIELVRCLTDESIFDLTRLPERLAIIGAGPIGLELAQAFRRLGSDVVVIDDGHALDGRDPELTAIVLARLEREGVELHQNARVERIEPAGTGVRLMMQGGKMLEGSDLLIAGSRRPNVGGLGLETARVKFDADGIKVGSDLRTSNRRIYAIGGAIVGNAPVDDTADHQASLVLRAALFRMPAKFDPAVIPRVTRTDPEIAAVGLDEAQARQTHGAIQVLRWPFAESDRAQAEGRTQGHIKLIASKSGRILGVGLVGPQASELIGLWSLALAKKSYLVDLAALALPSRTLGEVSKRAALAGYATGLNKPWLGRILRLLRRFG